MLLTEKEVDAAFQRVFVGVSSFLAKLHDGLKVKFPGDEFAVTAIRDLEAVAANFGQQLKGMQAETAEVEVGVRAKRSELEVASKDLKAAQERLVELAKKAR